MELSTDHARWHVSRFTQPQSSPLPQPRPTPTTYFSVLDPDIGTGLQIVSNFGISRSP